jgi:tetratricopeptide (TPR) repeat protein
LTIGVVFATMIGLALDRGRVWRDERLFWMDMLRKSPIQAEANYQVGEIYGNEGRNAEALTHASYCVQGNPEHALGYVLLGKCYGVIGEHEEAIQYFRKGISLDPQLPDGHANLAVAYLKTNRPDQAVSEMDAVGVSFLHLRQPGRAAAAFGRAVELEPKNCLYLTHLAQALVELNQSQQAVQVLQRALRVDPNYAPALEMLRDLRP